MNEIWIVMYHLKGDTSMALKAFDTEKEADKYCKETNDHLEDLSQAHCEVEICFKSNV